MAEFALLLTLQSQIQFLMNISMHSVKLETISCLHRCMDTAEVSTVSAAWRRLSLLVSTIKQMSLLWTFVE